MGGLAFFCTQLSEPDGNLELLKLGFAAMNAEPDPTEEERRGGAGGVGKVVFSAGPEALVMVCNVPANRQVDTPNADPEKPPMEAMHAKKWLEHVCARYHSDAKYTKAKEIKILGDVSFAEATIPCQMDMGFFAIKMKDDAMKDAYALLNEKHCFEDDGDDESDYCIGENPMADDY